MKLVPHKLSDPLTWPTPKTIFVNSMSDLFQEGIPDAFVVQVGRVMQMADWHTYQVLTKRAEQMRDMLAGPHSFASRLDHVWWGVSVEDRKYGLPRIDALRDAPAALRFLSVEPLLEDLGNVNLDGIHWVIVGGESGAGARTMKEEWVVRLRDQCDAANVPFFFKQWGGARKSEGGRMLNGRTYDAMPQSQVRKAPARQVRLGLLETVKEWETAYDVPGTTASQEVPVERVPLLF